MVKFKWSDIEAHVEVVQRNDKGQPTRVLCAYEGCKRPISANVSRVVSLFLGTKEDVAPCSAPPQDLVDKLKGIQKQKAEQESKKRKVAVLDQSTSDRPKSSSSSWAGANQSTIQAAFHKADKSFIDAAVIRFFVANGIAFNVSRNKYFQEFVQAVARAGPGYQPPKYERLRTTLLDSCVKDVKHNTEEYLSTAKTNGCTITSDGWSSVQNRPLLNVLAVTATGPVFLTAIDTSGETKGGHLIANLLIEQIESVGPANVIQVITDNATNCVLAGQLIEAEYPHITWTPCTAHCCDLYLEDLGKLDFMKEKVAEAKQIVTFITNHHKSLAIYRQYSAEYDGLELLKPAETRFAYHFIVMQRLLKVKAALNKTVTSDEWEQWTESTARVRNAADEVRDLVVKKAFWSGLDQVVELVRPVVELLRMCDGDTPCIGKVYNACSGIEKHIDQSALPARVKKVVAELWAEEKKGRWDMLHSRMHAAGYALDPEFQTHDFDGINPEIMKGFMDVVEKLVPDADDQADAFLEHAQYRQQLGVFGRPLVKSAAKKMPAHEWWLQFGGMTPTLQKVAIKVLSQVSSACACERNWSTFDFVHNKRRNRLTAARATDLVYAFSNMRLVDKTTAVDFTQPAPKWGEDSDDQESDPESGAGGEEEMDDE